MFPLHKDPDAMLRDLDKMKIGRVPDLRIETNLEKRMKLRMSNFKLVLCGLLLALFAAPRAQAQTTIDFSKITCEQFLTFKVTDPNFIALWLSGYYNGKRDNTIVEVQSLKANAEKVKHYCFVNSKQTVMQAVENIFGEKQ
jgi:acid stress chaperone HdeB